MDSLPEFLRVDSAMHPADAFFAALLQDGCYSNKSRRNLDLHVVSIQNTDIICLYAFCVRRVAQKRRAIHEKNGKYLCKSVMPLRAPSIFTLSACLVDILLPTADHHLTSL